MRVQRWESEQMNIEKSCLKYLLFASRDVMKRGKHFTGGILEKKVFSKNSCSEIKKKLPGDHSHKTIFSLMSTDIGITFSTQGCLKQASFNIHFSILNIFTSR